MKSREKKIASGVKQPAGINAQIKKLESRGCIISDKNYAAEILTTINYYRLVHYFELFLRDKYHYEEGTTFEKGIRLYDFDRGLRSLMLVMLEEIEISLRAMISNYHAMKYGALGYLNASSFDIRHKHQPFISKIERLIETNSKLSMVSHHKSKYSGYFPLWVITELFSFGTLAFFYQEMYLEDKRNIVIENYGKGFDSRHLDSWFDCLSDLRNRCAHYNRLYGNNTQMVPRACENEVYTPDNSLFGCIYVMKLLCKRKAAWLGFTIRLLQLTEEYGDIADIKVLGFPDGWYEILEK